MQTTASASHLIARAHEMPFGSDVLDDGKVRFQLWAPNAEKVDLYLYEEGQGTVLLDMASTTDGWFRLVTEKARPGSRYHYRIDGGQLVPDPASRFQPADVHGPSEVIDPRQFQWRDCDWSGRRFEEAVIYELHVGTFSEEGTFDGVRKKLDYLVDLGVTAIELMPISDFPGARNWGYDGVLPFAPDSIYGHPNSLKELINSVHQRGLMIFLDVVYNHFGPEGNYLHAYAKEFFTDHHHTPWGAAINFDQRGSQIVRQFFIHNALYWLNEFSFDGLRLDAVHAIKDGSREHILKEISYLVQAGPMKSRMVHLVLENDDNASNLLVREHNRPKYYTAQWNDDVHHALHVLATGESTGYYCDYVEPSVHGSATDHLIRCLMEGFSYQGDRSNHRNGEKRGEPSASLPSAAFVSFLQNHDQIGNRAFGERITTLAAPLRIRALTAIVLLAPQTPLLFMGEEWGASTPFLYFCDLGEELGPLVREGRRKEFAKFAQFQDPAVRETIPDPIALATFQASKLNWSELYNIESQQWLQFHKQLLKIRREEVVPRLSEVGRAHVCSRFGPTFSLEWSFNENAKIILVANLADQEGTTEISIAAGTKVIYASSERTSVSSGQVKLPPWCVLWLVNGGQ